MTVCEQKSSKPTLFTDERKRPRKDIHEIRQPIGVGGAVKLPNIHNVTFIFQHRGLVVINVKVVRRRENSHNGGEARRFCLAIHAVS